jgi:hypothetical protein
MTFELFKEISAGFNTIVKSKKKIQLSVYLFLYCYLKAEDKMDEFRRPTGGNGVGQPTRLADESPVSAICLSVGWPMQSTCLSVCLSTGRQEPPVGWPMQAPCLSVCRPAHKKASKIENLIVFFFSSFSDAASASSSVPQHSKVQAKLLQSSISRFVSAH